MSTPNFAKQNASKYYAVTADDEIDCDDLRLNIQFAFGIENNVDEWDDDRNYEGHIVSQIVKDYGKWRVEFNIMIRSAYYAGATLDWSTRTVNEITGEEYEYGYYEPKELPQYINHCIATQAKKAERIFTNFSTPLNCIGIFSNGEAVYRKA